MISVSPYQSGVLDFNYEPYQPNLDLEMKVLLYKQDKFDKAYQGIQKLRKQALNIQFEHEGRQKQIDNFNSKISKQLAELDTGNFDLSDPSIVNKYTSMFSEISSDIQLVKDFRIDSKIKDQVREIAKMRDSKNPEEAGYHNINARNFERRRNAYKKSSISDLSNSANKVYYNKYVDYNTELSNLYKDIQKETIVTHKRLNNGNLLEETWVGKNPERIREVTNQYFQGRGKTQLQEEAEYDYYNKIASNPSFKDDLKINYTTYLDEKMDNIDDRVSELQAAADASTGDEKIAYLDTIASLNRSRSIYSNKFKELNKPGSIDDSNAVAWATELAVLEAEDRFTDTYGRYAKSRKYVADPLYQYGLQISKLSLQEMEMQIKMLEKGLDVDSSGRVYKTGQSGDLGYNIINPYTSPIKRDYNIGSPEDKAAAVDHIYEGIGREIEDGILHTINIFEDGVNGDFKYMAHEKVKIIEGYTDKAKQILKGKVTPGSSHVPVGVVTRPNSLTAQDSAYNYTMNTVLNNVLSNSKFDYNKTIDFLASDEAKDLKNNSDYSNVIEQLEELADDYHTNVDGMTKEEINELATDPSKLKLWKGLVDNEWIGKNPFILEFEDLVSNALAKSSKKRSRSDLSTEQLKNLVTEAGKNIKTGNSKYSNLFTKYNRNLQVLKTYNLAGQEDQNAIKAFLNNEYDFPLFTGRRVDFTADIKGAELLNSRSAIATAANTILTEQVKEMANPFNSDMIRAINLYPDGQIMYEIDLKKIKDDNQRKSFIEGLKQGKILSPTGKKFTDLYNDEVNPIVNDILTITTFDKNGLLAKNALDTYYVVLPGLGEKLVFNEHSYKGFTKGKPGRSFTMTRHDGGSEGIVIKVTTTEQENQASDPIMLTYGEDKKSVIEFPESQYTYGDIVKVLDCWARYRGCRGIENLVKNN